jgi:hypothetical protein
MNRLFGRLPRGNNPKIPKLSLVAVSQPPLPTEVNYSIGMPANLGAMLNDTLGDCTCAAVGHAIQVWSFNVSGTVNTPPDNAIEKLYEEAGGYVPGNPATDNGAVIQTVLSDWLQGAVDGNRLTAFVEIDQRRPANIKRGIWEGGAVDIGFDVPAYMNMNPGATWDVDPQGDNTIIGGHSVILIGYQSDGTYVLESWGSIYYMTPAFMERFCDEAYMLANQAWVETNGSTPAGLNILQLEALMQAMREHTGTPRRNRHHRRRWKHTRPHLIPVVL